MQVLYSVSSLQIFIESIILGFATGIYYEIFRLIRCAGLNKKSAIFLQDIFFIITSGIAVFLFTFAVNEGSFRSFELIGILIGFFLYYFTLGRLIFMLSRIIIDGICRFLKFLYKNTALRIYITLDKFYKKGKIIIEDIKYRHFETRILKNAKTGFLQYQERKY